MQKFVFGTNAKLPWWLSGKEYACQCRRPRRRGFDHWVRKIPWRSKWQPTPVFLPGECHGQRSLLGYSLWGCKESDTKLYKELTDTVNVYPLRPSQDPAPRLHYCFLAAPPLSLYPLPFLCSNCSDLSFGTQGRLWRLKSIPNK